MRYFIVGSQIWSVRVGDEPSIGALSKMSLGWMILLVGGGALVGAIAVWLRARRVTSSARRHARARHRRIPGNKSPGSALPDGKRCAEIAGGPLDLMADYDVSHPYWYLAVEDD